LSNAHRVKKDTTEGDCLLLKRSQHGISAGKVRSASINVERMREMKAQGLGPTAIAKTLGIGRTSVYRMLEVGR
jgi:DNA invertase Pin-like site-specific DNA recombinase